MELFIFAGSLALIFYGHRRSRRPLHTYVPFDTFQLDEERVVVTGAAERNLVPLTRFWINANAMDIEMIVVEVTVFSGWKAQDLGSYLGEHQVR